MRKKATRHRGALKDRWRKKKRLPLRRAGRRTGREPVDGGEGRLNEGSSEGGGGR
jgi:hypothetical protein